jgi:hypothetical protein
MERINNIVKTVETVNNDAVGFLKKSIELRDSIELSIAKPFRTEINVYPEELPQEMVKIR